MTEPSKEKPFVSVIIPTWREAKILNQCLNSLLEQDYPKDKYEIILISLNKLNIENERVRIIYNVDYANSRNAGAKIAKGELFAFVDDDCLIPKDWISKAVRYFQNDRVAIIGGPALPFEKETLPYRIGGYLLASPFGAGFATSRYKLLPTVFEAKEYSLLTANNLMRRDAFEAILGFDANQVPAEESDLYFRIKKAGYKLLYVPEIFVWHRAKPIFSPLINKIFFYSSGRGVLLARKPQTIKLVYLIPSCFVISLLGLSILSIFHRIAFYLLLEIIFIYTVANIINALYIFLKFEKRFLVFLYSLLAVPLMHLSYGFGLLYGVFRQLFGTVKGGLKAKSKY